MDRMTKARTGLVLDFPFYGHLSLRLKMVEDPACPTAWTDGDHIGFNPTWVESVGNDVAKSVVAHEVMHCAQGHQFRRDDRDPKRWNEAADYVVNSTLLKEDFELWDGALYDPNFEGMSTEQVYSVLSSKAEEEGDDDDDDRDKDSANDNGNQPGEVRDAKGDDGEELSESEKRQKEQEWKVSVAQAGAQAKAAGELSDAVEQMLDDIVNPKIDWRELLRRFVEDVARNDFSWTRPDRRYVHQGIYLPGMYSDEIGKIVSIWDTSGSIYSYMESLNQFNAELKEILGDFQIESELIHCDDQVRKVETINADSEDITPVGGGNTDFRPPFELIDESGEEPSCAIYFTDGMCDRFPEPPSYPVLWVLYPVYGGINIKHFDPPFGEVVGL